MFRGQTALDRFGPILRQTANRTARKYRLDADDLLGQAYLLYVRAAIAYNPRYGPFEHLLRVRLKRLIDTARTNARRARLLHRVSDRLLAYVPARANYRNPTADLDGDALLVAKLALASRPGLRPSRIRRMVRDYLFAIGWSTERIDAASARIRGVI